jgi:hypothetical protein
MNKVCLSAGPQVPLAKFLPRYNVSAMFALIAFPNEPRLVAIITSVP